MPLNMPNIDIKVKRVVLKNIIVLNFDNDCFRLQQQLLRMLK